jgi:hypothetical protein
MMISSFGNFMGYLITAVAFLKACRVYAMASPPDMTATAGLPDSKKIH